jgi:hypothetical protein
VSQALIREKTPQRLSSLSVTGLSDVASVHHSRSLCRTPATYGKLPPRPWAKPTSADHGGPRLHLLHRPEPPCRRQELSTVLGWNHGVSLRPDGLYITPDQTSLRSVLVLHATSLISLRYIAGLYIYRVLNRITCYYTYSSVTLSFFEIRHAYWRVPQSTNIELSLNQVHVVLFLQYLAVARTC